MHIIAEQIDAKDSLHLSHPLQLGRDFVFLRLTSQRASCRRLLLLCPFLPRLRGLGVWRLPARFPNNWACAKHCCPNICLLKFFFLLFPDNYPLFANMNMNHKNRSLSLGARPNSSGAKSRELGLRLSPSPLWEKVWPPETTDMTCVLHFTLDIIDLYDLLNLWLYLIFLAST